MPIIGGITSTPDVEYLALDGLVLNDDTFGLAELDLTPPKQRADWIGSADSEHQVLYRDPLLENRTVTAKLQITPQTQMDAALDYIGQVRDKLAEASKTRDGLELEWSPAESTRSAFFDVLAGEIVGLPINWDEGWLAKAPTVYLSLTCKPYWRGQAFAGWEDQFATSLLNTEWGIDTGAGSLSVTGGLLTVSSVTEKRLYFNAVPQHTDVQARVRVNVAAAGGSNVGVILKRVDNGDALSVRTSGGGTNISVAKTEGGVQSLLASAAFALSPSTPYWVRGRIAGNDVVAEIFTSGPPTVTSTPAASASHTLTGANATAYGAGVKGYAGLALINPGDTDETYDGFVADFTTYSSVAPVTTLTVADVGGDAPALETVAVTNLETVSARWVEWGQQQRSFTTPTSPPDLVIDSDSMTTTGYLGSQTTRSGAYDPNSSGNNVIQGIVGSGAIAICATGAQSHIGRYRVAARAFVADTGDIARLRLSWRVGDGPWSPNAWAAPAVPNAWARVPLGTIDIPAATTGTQSWEGRVEAYTTSGAFIGIDIDFVYLMPTDEGYGLARAPLTVDTPTTWTAVDSFYQTAGALTGKALPVGGTWAGAGDADDFQVNATTGTIERSATSDANSMTGRFALAGTSTPTATAVQVDFKFDSLIADQHMGLLARYTSVTNTAVLRLLPLQDALQFVEFNGAGSSSIYGQVGVSVDKQTWYTLRLLVLTDGTYGIWLGLQNAPARTPILVGHDSNLSTGGPRQSGRVGVYDANVSGTMVRSYDNFRAWVPTSTYAIASNRSIQFTSTDTRRENASGGTWGSPPVPRGGRPLLPVTGDTSRTSRLAVVASSSDLEQETWDDLLVNHALTLTYTPRGVVVPRT